MNYDYNELLKICRQKSIYNDKIIGIISNILDRIENPNDDEDIFQSLDDELIYYDDQWLIFREYANIDIWKAKWEDAIENFTNDLFSITAQLQKE